MKVRAASSYFVLRQGTTEVSDAGPEEFDWSHPRQVDGIDPGEPGVRVDGPVPPLAGILLSRGLVSRISGAGQSPDPHRIRAGFRPCLDGPGPAQPGSWRHGTLCEIAKIRDHAARRSLSFEEWVIHDGRIRSTSLGPKPALPAQSKLGMARLMQLHSIPEMKGALGEYLHAYDGRGLEPERACSRQVMRRPDRNPREPGQDRCAAWEPPRT